MLQEAHILNQQVADEEERERAQALAHERQISFSGPFFDLAK
jgi:hypothetical protein